MPRPHDTERPTTMGRAVMLVHTGQAARRVDLTEQLGLTRSATGSGSC